MEKYVTSLELSKELYEVGFRKETKFWWKQKIIYVEKVCLGIESYELVKECPKTDSPYKRYPAYLSDELLEILPEKITKGDENYLRKIVVGFGYAMIRYLQAGIGSEKIIGDYTLDIDGVLLPNSLAKMAIYLKEQEIIK